MNGFSSRYDFFAKRLSEICGQQVSSEELRSFEKPMGEHTNLIPINSKLSGCSFSRKIEFGERFGVNFRLDIVPVAPEITSSRSAKYVEVQEMYDNQPRRNVVLEALNTLILTYESPRGASYQGDGRVRFNVTGLE